MSSELDSTEESEKSDYEDMSSSFNEDDTFSKNGDEDEETADMSSDSDNEEGSDSEDEGEVSSDQSDDAGLLEEDDNFKHMKTTDISSQIKKGICVRNQSAMWENLLEVRIQLQKCLVTANKMPKKETLTNIKKESGAEFSNKINETKVKLCETLDKFLLLQKLLLKQFPETKNIGQQNGTPDKNEDTDDEEIPSDTESEKSAKEEEIESEAPKRKKRKLEEYEEELSYHHKNYTTYRNNVIQKWNDKTRVVLKGGATSHSVVDQISYNLSNKDKLIKRTQLKRSQYLVLGEETEKDDKIEQYNTEIFDDDDFYHELLRELIEVKSSDITDPIQLGRQWIQLQNMRSKMKRKIDPRATKGRKIRYAIHNKLVNFMAPFEEHLWTDEAKNELYNSLFGKNQPVINL